MNIFSRHVTRDKTLIYDIRAALNNEARYFIVKVPPAKQRAFLKAVEQDAGFRLEDYGEILHRGWDEPDAALKARLHAQYGIYSDTDGIG